MLFAVCTFQRHHAVDKCEREERGTVIRNDDLAAWWRRAFHLIPRVLNYWAPGDYTAALGIGKLITSVTMTLFYLLMEYARRERYKNQWRKAVDDFRMGTERYPYRALLFAAERMDKH